MLVFYFGLLFGLLGADVWVPFVPSCGDVEQNPGPPGTTFLQFVGPLGDVFTAACDQTVLARQLTDLHFRLKSLGVALSDLPQILLVSDSTPAESSPSRSGL